MASSIVVPTCALYGTTNYANSWLGINFIVMLASLSVVAAVYTIGKLMPARTRSKINGIVRFEIIQIVISAVLLSILLGSSLVACNISSAVSMQVAKTSMSPLSYADWYVGSVSLNKGLTLLSNIYATSVYYSVYSTVVQMGYKILVPYLTAGANRMLTYYTNKVLNAFAFCGSGSAGGAAYPTGGAGSPPPPPVSGGCAFVNIKLTVDPEFADTLNNLAGVYIDIFSPILIIAIGLLFIQYLMIPIIQYTAFTIILPVAIAMRSIAFASGHIGDSANALIAIAVALYLIYPMTVAFDSYAVAWIFSANNPSYQYLSTTYLLNGLTPYQFFSSASAVTGSGSVFTSVSSMLFGVTPGSYSFYAGALPGNVMSTLRNYINEMAQFILISTLLFAFNIAVTMGFAMSLYKALGSGLGESAKFW